MSHHPTVAEQLSRLAVPCGHLALWALGQHGFLLKGGTTVIIIDAYLSDSIAERGGAHAAMFRRLAPIAADPATLELVNMVLITHHHGDHCDPQTLAPLLAAAPNAQVLTSYRAAARLAELGIGQGRVTVPPASVPLRCGDEAIITAVPAAHYELEPNAEGEPAYLGFLIQLNGVTLYHSGDTLVYPGLAERLAPHAVDIACLPINGRDWLREQAGLVGNMDYREAADLAAAIGARVLIPAHNDMFAANRVNPAYFTDYIEAQYPGQRWHMLRAGELYYYVSR